MGAVEPGWQVTLKNSIRRKSHLVEQLKNGMTSMIRGILGPPVFL